MMTIAPIWDTLVFDDGTQLVVDRWSYEVGPSPLSFCMRVVLGDTALVLNGTLTADGFAVDPGHIEGDDPHERLRAAYLGIGDGQPVPTQADLDEYAAVAEEASL